MQPSKPAKSIINKDRDDSPSWLSLGFICLLVCGTLGAKALLIVDKDLEIKTKFIGKNWQLNSKSLGKYVNTIDRFTDRQLKFLGNELRQKSTQILTSTRTALSRPQNLCVPASELSTVLDLAQQKLHRVADDPIPSKIPTPVIKHPPVPTTPTIQHWCITNDMKK
jgi:hypothetical protein